MFDYRGTKVRYDAALRRNYVNVDQDKCRRIAKQLIEGKHIEAYGFDSARSVVINAAEQVSKAIVIRPTTKLVRYQRANSAVVTKQTRVNRAVESITNQVSNSLYAQKRIAELEKLYDKASRKQRRNIKYIIHSIKSNHG